LRSTHAVAAAGQELRALGLSVGVPAAEASGVARGPDDGKPIAADRVVACPDRVVCATRDAAFPGEWPSCQPAAVVPATIMKAKTAVSR
jgi:hypothetical protein